MSRDRSATSTGYTQILKWMVVAALIAAFFAPWTWAKVVGAILLGSALLVSLARAWRRSEQPRKARISRAAAFAQELGFTAPELTKMGLFIFGGAATAAMAWWIYAVATNQDSWPFDALSVVLVVAAGLCGIGWRRTRG